MDLVGAFLPFIVLMAVMYFMMIRPQKKQQEQKQNMLNNMKKGDQVVTIGGLHGIIDEVTASGQTVVLDCEGVYLTFEKMAIARILEGAAVVDRREVIESENDVVEAELINPDDDLLVVDETEEEL